MEGEGASGSKTAAWMDKRRHTYRQATRHPFILSIADGSVDLSAFKTWLGQDYIFIREFVPFLASIMLKASKQSDDESDMEVLLGGMAALSDELAWFRREASKWDVQLLGNVQQKSNLEYCSFLQSLMLPEVEYATAITAFWAIETVYQESFSLCLESSSKTPVALLETCGRWGNPGFGQYCRSLRKIADRCLDKAPTSVLQKAEEAFISVLEHEINVTSPNPHPARWQNMDSETLRRCNPLTNNLTMLTSQ